MKKVLLALAFMALGTTAAVAQNAPKAKAKTTKTQKAKAKETMVYACPMNCEAPHDKPGKCGKCGMDLVATKKK